MSATTAPASPAAAPTSSAILAPVAAADTSIAPAPAQRLSDGGSPPTANQLSLGTTLTQDAYDAWEDPTSVSAGKAVLSGAVRFEAQHLMGFGALNPSPAPGVTDWSSLDARLATIREAGAEPVLILCCSPDWMKGGVAGTTDWTTIENAPLPAHFADFAALAAAAAQRYPFVKYFVVWNELKGFYDPATNNWKIDQYLNLWRLTATAIRAVRPDALIGGPYVPIDSFTAGTIASHPSAVRGPWGTVDERALDVLSDFLTSTDADFIAVDASTTPKNTDQPPGNPFAATAKFSAIDDWLRARTAKPIWWVEFYPQPPSVDWTADQQAAAEADSLMRMAYSGASAAFLWGPIADASGRPSLTDQVHEPGGGNATATARVFATLNRLLQPGVPIQPLVSNDPDIEGWRIGDVLVVVNLSANATTIGLPNGGQALVTPWSVSTVAG